MPGLLSRSGTCQEAYPRQAVKGPVLPGEGAFSRKLEIAGCPSRPGRQAHAPFSPLGRGFPAGRISSPEDLPQDDFRRRLPRFQQDALRANLAIAGRVRQLAERIGATPAQVALGWVLTQGQYVVPIPGTMAPRAPAASRTDP
jgi:Aldo/keto reductase family